ncbi:periplasmic heavy metal sensor [Bradyrhizobium sp. 186]|uniref:Spy/CpxP family protein refolding chaperone n=1 Tax=Bradyrhizobium sp. 186 TaxID=2782654 RepID=UPI0020008866|nr:periplasmic heavy metal sensor [Bradyrhizobium sp. 186]UPK37868.1 periplasmic heavy metal sensor [Bradyrhizobium sp. 186]
MRPCVIALSAAALLLGAVAAAAQQQHGPATPDRPESAAAVVESPYAGMERRTVKGLSEQQITDLKTGRGMGLALAAELNDYPGPSHVLELADSLQLSDEQRTKTKALLDAMKAETIPVGEQLVAEESTLDRLFANKTITRASLDAMTTRIGATQGTLRAAHLRSHLAMREVLSLTQIGRYAELRGYAADKIHHGQTD